MQTLLWILEEERLVLGLAMMSNSEPSLKKVVK